ncbi:hypothetical protein BsWGS_08101 [Bradybaena similaris]
MDEVLPTQFSSASQSMDTTDENGNNESQEIIPWEFVPYDVRLELIMKLNPTAPVKGNDWRMLGFELGCTRDHIDFLESEKENNTKALFKYYDVKPGASFNEIYSILAKMDRKDCLAVLNTAYAKIRQAYIEKQRSPSVHTAGTPDPLVTGGHNQPPNYSCPCTHVGHSTLAHRGHTYCTCGNSYTICGCVDNSYLHSHPTHHFQLPHPRHREISQLACTPVHASPSHTCSVNINIMKKSGARFGPSGNEENSSAGTLSSPAGSLLGHQPHVHTSNPGCQVDSFNVNGNNDEPSAMVACDSSTRQPFGRDHLSATYPLMKKTKHDPSTEDSKYLELPRKALSVPADMKPKAFRKAFRNINVFVTYSDDSDRHRMQVLMLCKFLQDNGFACFVDVSEDNSSDRRSLFMDSCRQKMAEADFILVCISNKYLEDIASDRSVSSVKEYRLHAREIYQLLSKHLYRFHNNPTAIAKSPCVIPLLFDKMMQNHIPNCMIREPTYRWPEEYMNLAWLLTKPEERIRMPKEKHGRLL